MTTTFRTAMITAFKRCSLEITPLDGLEGDEYIETKSNNEAMEGLFDLICNIHEEYKSTGKQPPVIFDANENDVEPTFEVEKPKPVPKKKATPVSKKSTKSSDEEGVVEKKKREPTKYSLFTSVISARLKSDEEEVWNGNMIRVDKSVMTEHLANQKLTQFKLIQDAEQNVPGIAGNFKNMNGEVSLEEIYKMARVIVRTASNEGKVHPFKVAGLMWTVCNGVNPFL